MKTDKVKSVKNVMVVTKDVPRRHPPKDAIETQPNVDFATYSSAVQEVHAANDPKVTGASG